MFPIIFFENLISGTLPFTFLMVTGLYLSFKTGFIQITRLGEAARLTRRAFLGRDSKEGISSFKSACTALSATVGTGNIAGVAGAISIGGAGAVFWMWVSSLLGMCIKAAEITLAVIYREKNSGGFAGGPMYYIKNGLGGKFKVLSFIFCLAAIPAVFCSGNLTQTNAAVITFCSSNTSRLIFGIIFCAACFFSIPGGFKRIANITEKLVPFMSVLYIALCIAVVLINKNNLYKAFEMIFQGAFSPKAVTGGAVGSIITCAFIGASRGVFSNEAGLGTSAMAHSVATDADPKNQGLFGIFEVYIDTILLCTLTALTILCSSVKINYGDIASTELVAAVLRINLGDFGNIALSIMMCLFAFSSIIGWAVYGKLCWGFLFGKTGSVIFTLTYPIFCIFGAVCDSNTVWRISSVCNGIMLCVNLTALLILSPVAVKYLKKGSNIVEFKNRKIKEHTGRKPGIDY